MQTYLSVTPHHAAEAGKYTTSLALVSYRIGPSSSLLRQAPPAAARGCLLSVSDLDAPPVQNPGILCAAAVRECTRRGCSGVLLDFEHEVREDLKDFAERLSKELSRSGKTLYLPLAYLPKDPSAVGLLCTAISGGNFREFLQETQSKHKGRRLALDAQRLCMDFSLPSPTGEGTPLSQQKFHALTDRYAPSIYFSADLCAKYFTYTSADQVHFILFDDADTLRRKAALGASLGFSAVFFMWPEVMDLAPRLFG